MHILTKMATETTLRYALNLISCAQVRRVDGFSSLVYFMYFMYFQVVALKRKSLNGVVEVDDLKRCYTFFLDEKRSVQWVAEGTAGLVGEDPDSSTNNDRMEE